MRAALRDPLLQLSDAADAAYRALARDRGGRPRLTALRDLAEDLARIYEAYTGERWTYDQPANRRRDRMFPTAGAAWVARLIRCIDGDVSPENLDTVLRDVRSRLDEESRKPPPEEG